jgi:hypothetical protein
MPFNWTTSQVPNSSNGVDESSGSVVHHSFCQTTRVINVASQHHRDVVSEQLEWGDLEDGEKKV